MAATATDLVLIERNGVLYKATAGEVAALASGGSAVKVVITANVVNNNATANTLQSITGLAFPVTAGVRYRFSALIPYNSAATTTGARFTINGPAVSQLNYKSKYTLTATSETTNFASAYRQPTASNATSLTTGNLADIEGIIVPSASGTVQFEFASEIASSAITVLAGAHVIYEAI